jgi:SAM-dependent methyltransferase
MTATIQRIINRIQTLAVTSSPPPSSDKYEAESNFWREELQRQIRWYTGEPIEMYGESPPTEEEKIKVRSVKDSAILTWGKIHQQAKYLSDLSLSNSAFEGLRLLDIGAGPYPSAVVFESCELYCLDPLIPKYLEIGFPLHYYKNVHFVHGYSENMPIMDNFFDAVISVNAIDHVDDFYKSTIETRRVLKPNGKVRMHIHYHPATDTEPLELNDVVVGSAFSWCEGFRKVGDSKTKRGHTLTESDEIYTLWSNF